MKITRKQFLKAGGGALVIIAGKRVAGTFGASAAQTAAPGGLAAKRWAMVVDLKKCREKEGCTDCIAACHREHNVPHFNDHAHEVKWVWKEPYEHVFPEDESLYTETAERSGPVLVTCNHCTNPPCVRVCPTKATWKREDGIVTMDWHRCVGCRYCVAACPYGSRSFNWSDPRPHIAALNANYPTRTKGVVEKCTFCEERLAKGQLPACVEACPAKAIVFGDLEDPKSEVRTVLRERFSMRRKPELGTQPQIFYLI